MEGRTNCQNWFKNNMSQLIRIYEVNMTLIMTNEKIGSRLNNLKFNYN